MNHPETALVNCHCPYCGEPISLVVEPLAEHQDYIEDCEVCCRPMVVSLCPIGSVILLREDDA